MDNNIILALIFFTALIGGFFINRFLINRPIRFLVKKANISAERWSSQSKPIFGGITFFVIFISIAVVVGLFSNDSNFISGNKYIVLLLVTIISFLMGLADDLVSTPPSFKFIVQFICGLIFIFNGFFINISSYEYINYAITIIWVLGIMNSINMLDNMDAVTSLTSLSIIAGVVLAYLTGFFPNTELSSIFIFTAVCGAIISFLLFNWHPSKMYMGDNGSQFLGVILAFLGIMFFWNSTPVAELDYAYRTKQFIVIALAFVVPLTDTTTVTINRLLRKQSPFVGGKDHTTHHLFYLGLSTRAIGITLFLINGIGVFLAFVLLNLNIETNNIFYYFALYPFLVFVLLFVNTKISKNK